MKKLLLLGVAALGMSSIAMAGAVTVELTSTESCYVDSYNVNENYDGAGLDQLSVLYTQYRYNFGTSAEGSVKFNYSDTWSMYGQLALYKFDISEYADFNPEYTIMDATLTFTVTGSGDSKYCYYILPLGYNEEWNAEDLTYASLINNGTSELPTGLATDTEHSFQPLYTLSADETYPATLTTTTDFPYELTYTATDYVRSALQPGDTLTYDKDYISIAITENLLRYAYLATEATLTITYNTDTRVDVPIQYCTEDGDLVATGTSSAYNYEGYEISLSDDDIADFFDDFGEKWIYVSDNHEEVGDEGICTGEEEEDLVTIYVRKAELVNYIVNAVATPEEDGEEVTIAVIASGSDYEGEVVSYNYPVYLLHTDGVIYYLDANNKTYTQTLTLEVPEEGDTQSVELTATASDYSNVIRLYEAEDIVGMTATNAGNADIRCSMAMGAYAEDTITVCTLGAGTYKLGMRVWGNSGITFQLDLDNDSIFGVDCMGYIYELVSDEFTIFSEKTLTIPTRGTTAKCIDLIFIIAVDGDGELTYDAIKAVEAEAEEDIRVSGAYYDLAGRKVSAPQKGIYIRDGRKVLF